ncbi:MAG: hypothetical protein ACRDIL_01865, partial [Candidatus Limnocylindrales bacterium]
MTRSRSTRISAAVLALALVAAACGDDDDAADGTTAPDETAGEATTPAGTEPTGTDAPAGGPVDLAAVCPSPLVIQTDWFAEAEHGGLY